ncbi:unnamed protein product [Caenorhabditis brenneri]
MKHFGKKFGDYELHRANFLSEQFRDLITNQASVVFMNNHSFGEKLMLDISRELLLKMRNKINVVTIVPIINPEFSKIAIHPKITALAGGVTWTHRKPDLMWSIIKRKNPEPQPTRRCRKGNEKKQTAAGATQSQH